MQDFLNFKNVLHFISALNLFDRLYRFHTKPNPTYRYLKSFEDLIDFKKRNREFLKNP